MITSTIRHFFRQLQTVMGLLVMVAVLAESGFASVGLDPAFPTESDWQAQQYFDPDAYDEWWRSIGQTNNRQNATWLIRSFKHNGYDQTSRFRYEDHFRFWKYGFGAIQPLGHRDSVTLSGYLQSDNREFTLGTIRVSAGSGLLFSDHRKLINELSSSIDEVRPSAMPGNDVLGIAFVKQSSNPLNKSSWIVGRKLTSGIAATRNNGRLAWASRESNWGDIASYNISGLAATESKQVERIQGKAVTGTGRFGFRDTTTQAFYTVQLTSLVTRTGNALSLEAAKKISYQPISIEGFYAQRDPYLEFADARFRPLRSGVWSIVNWSRWKMYTEALENKNGSKRQTIFLSRNDVFQYTQITQTTHVLAKRDASGKNLVGLTSSRKHFFSPDYRIHTIVDATLGFSYNEDRFIERIFVGSLSAFNSGFVRYLMSTIWLAGVGSNHSNLVRHPTLTVINNSEAGLPVLTEVGGYVGVEASYSVGHFTLKLEAFGNPILPERGHSVAEVRVSGGWKKLILDE